MTTQAPLKKHFEEWQHLRSNAWQDYSDLDKLVSDQAAVANRICKITPQNNNDALLLLRFMYFIWLESISHPIEKHNKTIKNAFLSLFAFYKNGS